MKIIKLLFICLSLQLFTDGSTFANQNQISTKSDVLPWKYRIVMIDSRWPDRPFVLLVSKTNITGISSLEEMFKFGAQEQNYGYIGVPVSGILDANGEDAAHKWTFVMDADQVHFRQMTIELCDTDFHQVESDLDFWKPSFICPWGASAWVTEIWDESHRIFPR